MGLFYRSCRPFIGHIELFSAHQSSASSAATKVLIPEENFLPTPAPASPSPRLHALTAVSAAVTLRELRCCNAPSTSDPPPEIGARGIGDSGCQRGAQEKRKNEKKEKKKERKVRRPSRKCCCNGAAKAMLTATVCNGTAMCAGVDEGKEKEKETKRTRKICDCTLIMFIIITKKERYAHTQPERNKIFAQDQILFSQRSPCEPRGTSER